MANLILFAQIISLLILETSCLVRKNHVLQDRNGCVEAVYAIRTVAHEHEILILGYGVFLCHRVILRCGIIIPDRIFIIWENCEIYLLPKQYSG